MTDEITSDAQGIKGPSIEPFVPIVPPPSEHHALNTGLGTELGDNAKTMIGKINAGFAHVYALLTGTSAPIAGDSSSIFQSIEDRIKQAEGNLSGAASPIFASFEDRLKEIEGKLSSAPGEVAADLSDFVKKGEAIAKEEFDKLVNDVGMLGSTVSVIRDDVTKLEGLLNRAVDLFLTPQGGSVGVQKATQILSGQAGSGGAGTLVDGATGDPNAPPPPAPNPPDNG